MKAPSASLAVDPRGRAYLLAWHAWQRGERRDPPILAEYLAAPAPPRPPAPEHVHRVEVDLTVTVRIEAGDDGRSDPAD